MVHNEIVLANIKSEIHKLKFNISLTIIVLTLLVSTLAFLSASAYFWQKDFKLQKAEYIQTTNVWKQDFVARAKRSELKDSLEIAMLKFQIDKLQKENGAFK